MGIKEYRATGGNAALLKDYHRKSDSLAQWKINFLPDTATQIYGFDYLGSGNHGIYSGSEYYPYLSGNYDLRYKSVETGKTDKVIVDFGSYPEKDSIIFKDKYGVTLKLSKGNVLNFTGVAKPDTNYIYAYRGDEKIGKLSVNTYKQKTYKVVLVSVNGAKLPNTSELEKYLNEVYKQAAVSFEVETDELNIENLFPFLHGDKRRFSGYNDDQKRVLSAYDSRIKPDINYLFFIPDGAETNGVAGYNPLGYNFGFIYFGAGHRTIAHELAHGIASLEHPFQDDIQAKGKTDNLLDYNDGVVLWHFQWDKLQNPTNRIFKWNFEEEEAEGVEGLNPLISFKISGKITAENNYSNGDLFATLHTNDEIIIELISQDTTVNIRQLTWYFDKNKISTIDSSNNKVKITLDEKTISLNGNKLSIKDTLNNEISRLKFQAYLPPYVELSIDKKNYNGEFLFDDSFRRINNCLYDPTNYYKDYHSFIVGKNGKKNYVPILGLQLLQNATLLLDIKELDQLAYKDKNFKIKIFADDKDKIKFNVNTDTVIIDSTNLKTIHSIDIYAKEFYQGFVYAATNALNQKIGLLDYYCKKVIDKQITLCYVRFSAADNYPTFDYHKLENYLNKYSLNQLFRRVSIDTIHLDAFVDTTFNYQAVKLLNISNKVKICQYFSKSKSYYSNQSDGNLLSYIKRFYYNEVNFYIDSLLLQEQKSVISDKINSCSDSLTIIKLKQDSVQLSAKKIDASFYRQGKICMDPSLQNVTHDIYFITDVNKGTVGGFHNVGFAGGVKTYFPGSPIGETEEELCAHEFGHWLGLYHSFSKQPDKTNLENIKSPYYFFVKEMQQTQSNFMDYGVNRKTWFKFQMNNIR